MALMEILPNIKYQFYTIAFREMSMEQFPDDFVGLMSSKYQNQRK